MASITCSSDQRLSTSKRRLKPLMLRDYLLDDLSSCSSNGFKSFPRRQHPPSSPSSTVRRLLDAELKRSGLIHKPPRLTRRSRTTCGTAISNAVHKASTAFLNAVKLLPFHATVKGDQKQQGGGFSRSLSKRSFWRKPECVNEEKEQLSPVSILECPFKDDEDDDEEDEITGLISHQNDTYEKNARKSRRVNGLVRLEPLELEKRIEKYVEREEEDYSYHVLEAVEDESENRANRLFALVKSRIGETNNILASNVADNLLLDYLQEDNIGAKEETLMVKKVEDWVMDRQEEMFMSWEVREKREVYVKEMKWGCINGDEKENVVEELANGFFTFLVDEVIFNLAF
ncbi:hypothetical protein Bca4012_019914 [Brassica carinata]